MNKNPKLRENLAQNSNNSNIQQQETVSVPPQAPQSVVVAPKSLLPATPAVLSQQLAPTTQAATVSNPPNNVLIQSNLEPQKTNDLKTSIQNDVSGKALSDYLNEGVTDLETGEKTEALPKGYSQIQIGLLFGFFFSVSFIFLTFIVFTGQLIKVIEKNLPESFRVQFTTLMQSVDRNCYFTPHVSVHDALVFGCPKIWPFEAFVTNLCDRICSENVHSFFFFFPLFFTIFFDENTDSNSYMVK